MHNNIAKILPVMALSLLAAACVKPRTHIAAETPDIRPAALAAPVALKVETAFLRGGKPSPKDAAALDAAVRAALAEGKTAVADDNAAAVLHLSAQSGGGSARSAAKGLASGLTFGLIGSRFDDGYRFKCDYRAPDGRSYASERPYRVTTLIGNVRAADGDGRSVPARAAFRSIVRDAVNACLAGLQQAGRLPDR